MDDDGEGDLSKSPILVLDEYISTLTMNKDALLKKYGESFKIPNFPLSSIVSGDRQVPISLHSRQLIVDPIFEDKYKYYDDTEPNHFLKNTAYQHIDLNRRESSVSIREHVFFVQPYAPFFYDQHAFRRLSSKKQKKLLAEKDKVNSFFKFASQINGLKVTAVVPPEAHHIITSRLLEEGYIDDVLLTESNTGKILKSVVDGKLAQSFYDLYDSRVFVTGYDSQRISDFLHSLYHSHSAEPQYVSLHYIDGLVENKFNSKKSSVDVVSIDDYMRNREAYVPKPQVIKLDVETQSETGEDTLSSSA